MATNPAAKTPAAPKAPRVPNVNALADGIWGRVKGALNDLRPGRELTVDQLQYLHDMLGKVQKKVAMEIASKD